MSQSERSSGFSTPVPDDRSGTALIHECVSEWASRTPDAVAVSFGTRQLTYAQLDAGANRLAHHLIARGAMPDRTVAICMERSIESIVGVLGILKAGAAFVPMDPALPDGRLAFMLQDCDALAVLTQESLRDRLPGDVPAICLEPGLAGLAEEGDPPPPGRAGPDDLAYVIYTSGSTGTPKGVLIEHGGIRNTVASQRGLFDVGPGSRVLQLASPSFDASVLEITLALCAGARLCLASRDALLPGPGLVRLLDDEAITALFIAPSALAALPDAALPALRTFAVGAEACSAELVDRWAPGRRFLNLYGPTEASIWTSFEECRPGGGTPTIGRAIANTELHVLDGSLQPVPCGEPGELCIAGVGLARGYLNRPDLTAASFVRRPDSRDPADRLYRSGDLVRQLADGRIEFLGRIDDQVKIRGHRIAPREIEIRLAAHHAVRDCTVVAREVDGRGQQLVAYLVKNDGQSGTTTELRRHLATALPEYMVPAYFVVLDALPLTPSGKVDRRALPAPEPLRPDLEAPYRAPAGPTEETIAGIWGQVLGLERVGVDDGFFELGGHSLLAAQVIARVRDAFGVEPSVRRFFESPTVAELARAVESGRSDATRAGYPAIEPTPRDRPLPLSFAQERAWFIQQLHPGSAAYHAEMVFRFTGRLDDAALEAALAEIVRRHEIFRTSFPSVEGRPVQVVHADSAVSLRREDLSALPASRAAAELDRLIAEAFTQPFDLAEPQLVRWVLVRLGEREHALISVEHHLVHDGWSFNVFVGELCDLYNAFAAGAPSPLPEPSIQFADFAVWQRGWMDGAAADVQLDYWRRQLAGCPTVLDLPTDRPRPPVQTLAGTSLRLDLDPALCAALRALARREGVSLYMVTLAAFASLLSRWSGQTDICVGAGVANRRWREIEGLIGMVINTVTLRTDLSGDPTVSELLAHVREVCLGAYEHQDVPFGRVVEAVQPKRSPSHPPLYQVMFSFHDSPAPDLRLADLETELELGLTHGTSKFDLNVVLIPLAEQQVRHRSAAPDAGITLIWEYNTDLFDEVTMRRMTRQLVRLLEGITRQPDRPVGEIELLSSSEQTRLLTEWSGVTTPYPRDASIASLFAEVASARGETVALACGDARWTYAELATRSSQLAHHLIAQGVSPGDLVGVCLDRSPWAVASLLAILKAGAAYVPLDPEYPKDRLAYMLEDTGLAVLVTETGQQAQLPETGAIQILLDQEEEALASLPETAPEIETSATDLAYVMYTSGSTGLPKGVRVPHRAVVRLVRDTDYVTLGPDEVLLQLAPTSFDAATFEIWGALLNGARLAIAPERRFSLQELGDWISGHAVTTLWLTAPLFHQMVESHGAGLRGVRQLLAGGDVLQPDAVRRVLEEVPGCTVINGYGPTEGTTFTCCHRMTDVAGVDEPVPIGRPIANTRVYVLDARLRPTPIGVPGELYIGGDGLADGYHGAPELTAERFVADPFRPGERLYRSGDLTRWRRDGTLAFLGRLDGQVKVRGFRVEPGEIESVLGRHERVERAVVVAREDAPGDKRLVAYVVATQEAEAPSAQALRAHLLAQLPDYMVPSAYVVLDALPLTPSGKVDRKALPEPEAGGGAAFAAPRNDLERKLVAIWSEVLQRTGIGVHDDFFDLGGHSLLATQVASRVLRELGVELSLRVLLRAPTVAELAREVDAARSDEAAADAPLVRVARRGRRPDGGTR